MGFIYGFCDDSACAAVEAQHRWRFPDQRILFRDVLSCFYQTLHETGSLTIVPVQSEILEMFQGS
jgi:hypothetical protein